MARRLQTLIEGAPNVFAASVEAMGCGGVCTKCPAPEQPTAEKQVASCISSVSSAGYKL